MESSYRKLYNIFSNNLVQMSSSSAGKDRDFSSLLNRNCQRKMIRREKKRLKTISRVAYSAHKKMQDAFQQDEDQTKAIEKSQKKREKRRRQKLARKDAKTSAFEKTDGRVEDGSDLGDGFDDDYTLERFKNDAETVRLERMRKWVEDDDEEIARLETKLTKSKRRKKNKELAKDESEDELEQMLLGSENSENEEECGRKEQNDSCDDD